ncbi:hypothetical protein [Proteus terrae]|uniref:hypothetical protein n=1 Tax=Proteus terrae TaxID=1574161 RepID=UPI003525DC99
MTSSEYVLEDKRVDCLSIIHTTKLSDYLAFAEKAYEDKGGIYGQRAPLKTKTAQTIRERMVSDIIGGAVIPPIVIGILVDAPIYEEIKMVSDEHSFEKLNNKIDKSTLSIIDGMQRTTALLEAVKKDKSINNKTIRIEYWFSKTMNSLIYRMLVLNTGQVPWDIKRQLDTIYDSIIKELKHSIPNLDVRLIGQSSRRTQPGQYQSSKLIEYFLCFSSRKTDVDLKEKVSEDFAKMDAIESTSNNDFLANFKSVLKLLVDLDHEFSRFKDERQEGRIKDGKDIFTSVPAGVGFVTAAAIYIYGPPGFKSTKEDTDKSCQDLIIRISSLIERLSKLTEEDLGTFLQISLLNEKLSARSAKIGQYEREFYYKAFEACMKYVDILEDFELCWKAK